MNSHRIAIVGANGFIGRNLVSSLANSSNQIFLYNSSHAEMMLDPTFWIQSKFNSVIWLASKVNPMVAQKQPDLASKESELFIRYVENINNSSAQMIYISSGGTVYSDQVLPFTENSKATGINAYGRHKVILENIIKDNSSNFTILRLSNAYGRDQIVKNGQGVIAGWLESVRQDKPITLFGSTTLIRDFIHIDDVTSAIEQVVNKQLGNEVFNIGSGQGTSLDQLISEITLVTEKSLEVQILESRGFDRPEVWLDISKAKKFLSWKPVINLRDGIDLTWQAMNSKAIK